MSAIAVDDANGGDTMMTHAVRTPLIVGLVVLATLDTASASARQIPGGRGGRPDQTPVPQGQRIDARDGDTVVIEDNARVRIVRRRHGVVRAVYNAAARWLVLLLDEASTRGGAADGRVDATYTFSGLVGDWPLPERWEGDAQIDDYFAPEPGPGRHGAGFVTPQGLLQFLRPEDTGAFRDPAAAIVFSYRSSGSGGGGGVSFDQAERQQVAVAARNAEAQSHLPAGAGMGIAAGIVGGAPAGATSAQDSTAAPGTAPLRVGGNIAPPRKIVDAPVIYPAAAQEARIQGIVILEIVVGTDGSVTDARVLRSIPQLDEAAIETVGKWRYEPVLLNGNPVPVILTVTVNFTLQSD